MTASLTKWDREEGLTREAEDDYRALVRGVRRSEGFGLLFVRCAPVVGERTIARLRKDVPEKRLEVLRFEEPIDSLLPIVEGLENLDEIDVLVIAGLEKSFEPYIHPGYGGQGDYYKEDSVPRVLGALNLHRETFRNRFEICFVFLLPLFGLKYFMFRAPDFFDWRSGLFEIPMEQEEIAQNFLRLLLEGVDSNYQALSLDKRSAKIAKIQNLLCEERLTEELQAKLFFEQSLVFGDVEEYEEAIASLDKAIEFNPNFYQAWNNRGLALYKLGRYEQAIISLDKALEINSDLYEAWYNRGLTLHELGRYEESIVAYDKAIAIKPNSHEACFNRGNTLRQLGRNREAISSYDNAIMCKPDYYEALCNRGSTLSQSGQIEEAISSYDKAVSIKPDFHECWCNRGNLLSKIGRYDEAIDSYEKALSINPNSQKALFNKACTLALSNQVDRALGHLEQAIQLDAGNRELAKTDSDFDRMRSHPRFQALVCGTPEQTTVENVAEG
ncbi:tetratricopeptide repeat protein [Synechococcus sp. PCC 7336]|uniref:tetratricopeptide repeat protein n=1 Tax=Synechococcus sp. PCC 7336 TaxID=195250 RepID=UPI00034B0B63|nr:tetratricopeptide repeat protein [Synechococcus sp. PCC 7336]